MICSIDSPIGDIADAINVGRLDFIPKAKNRAEAIKNLNWFNNTLVRKAVSVADLTKKWVAGVNQEAMVYNVGGTSVNIEETFTSEGNYNFIKKKGAEAVKEIQSKEENVFKKTTGTRVHRAIELLIPNMITANFKDKIEMSSHMKVVKVVDIMAETGLSDTQMGVLKKMVSKLLQEGIAYQEKVNKAEKTNEKLYVSSEQKLMDKANRGGTADLVFVYSNRDFSHYDFKTIYPKYSSLNKAGIMQDSSGIPFYKYESWNFQLPKTQTALTNVVGLRNQIQSRVIPIQVTLGYENKKTIDKITAIRTFADKDEFLNPIPISELVRNKEGEVDTKLNEEIQKLYRLKKNFQLELENKPSYERQTYLKSRIDRLTQAISKIVVNKDIRTLIEDYTKLVNKYAKFDKIGVLSNINSINKEGESTYLDLGQIQELIHELDAFRGVLISTQGYYDEIGLSTAEASKYIVQGQILLTNILTMQDKLNEELFIRTNLSQEDITDITPVSKSNLLFDRFGEIVHPIFIKAKELLDSAWSKSRIDLQDLKVKIDKVTKNLEEWGNKNGLKGFAIFDKLIDKEKGTLYTKHSKEFTKNRVKAQKDKDIKFMTKYYNLKSDWEDIYKARRQKFLDNNNLDDKEPGDDKRIKFWETHNNPKDSLYSKYFTIYYEINPEQEKNILSTEYQYIQANAPLLAYYKFWEEEMSRMRKMLGLSDYQDLPNNFLPWIRADVVEQWYTNGFSAATGSFVDKIRSIVNIQDDNTINGDTFLKDMTNPETGEVQHTIPRFFLNPLKNNDGKIDATLKSYDLSKSMYLFAEMAYNYNHLSQIEANINAMATLVQTQGVVLQNKDGKMVKTLGNMYSKVTGNQLDEVSTFNALVDYHLYGIKYQDKVLSPKVKNFLLKAKQFQVAQQLSFAPLSQTSAYFATKANSYFEGVKGFFYTTKQKDNAERIWSDLATAGKYLKFTGAGLVDSLMGNHNVDAVKYRALLNFFNPYNKSKEHISSELGANSLKNLLDKDLGFIGFRKGSEKIDTIIFFSMLQNYAVDKNGKIGRLKSLKKTEPDIKSILDSIEVVNEKLVIPGIINERGEVNHINYSRFRNQVLNVSSGIKGEMNEQDINSVNTTLIGNMLMTYKNWLPSLIKERYGNTKYDPITHSIKIGKANALWLNDVGNLAPEQRNVLGIAAHITKTAGKLILDISTFGFLKQFKVNEDRAAQLLQIYKDKYPNIKEIQDYNLEDYIEYMQGQIRSQIVELRIYSAFLAMLILLGGDWDDDNKPDYKETYIGRTAFRLLNRTYRELGFFYGSDALEMASKNTIPVISLVFDTLDLVGQLFDEPRDYIFGENSKNDQKDISTTFIKLVPNVNKISSTLEWFDKDKKKEY